jgi:hypothetical protein
VVKVFAYLSKKDGLDMRAFIDYYVTRGSELNRREDAIDFDVITELVFPDRAAFADWLGKLSGEAIARDEERFLDRSRTRACLIEEHTTSGCDLGKAPVD